MISVSGQHQCDINFGEVKIKIFEIEKGLIDHDRYGRQIGHLLWAEQNQFADGYSYLSS